MTTLKEMRKTVATTMPNRQHATILADLNKQRKSIKSDTSSIDSKIKAHMKLKQDFGISPNDIKDPWLSAKKVWK